MSPAEKELCSADGGMCDRPVEKSGLCAAHRQRMKRKKRREASGDGPKTRGAPRLEPGEPIRDRTQHLLKAIESKSLELADAEADASPRKFAYIKERLRAALRRATVTAREPKAQTA